MKDFDEPGFLAPTGLFLGPTKYMVIQGEPGAVIRGKKVRTDPSPDTSFSAGIGGKLSCNVRGISFSAGIRWCHCEEDWPGACDRHLRRANDPWTVQHGDREARRLPRRARPVNGSAARPPSKHSTAEHHHHHAK